MYNAKKFPNNNIPLKVLEDREDAFLLLDKSLGSSAGRSLQLRSQFHQGKFDDAFEDINAQGEWIDKLNDFDNLEQKKSYLIQTEKLLKKVGKGQRLLLMVLKNYLFIIS